MHSLLRAPLLTGVLLLAAAPCVRAESPMPDPIPPAVVGRPLDQWKPLRPAREKPAAAKPARSKQAVAKSTKPKQARQASARPPAAPTKAVRAAPRTGPGEVGHGTHFARKPLAPGAYFSEKHRIAARKYYEEHPVAGAAPKWQIGEPVPRGAAAAAAPADLVASLPQVPAGHRYIQLGGDLVLIAEGSRMVIDGISRRPR